MGCMFGLLIGLILEPLRLLFVWLLTRLPEHVRNIILAICLLLPVLFLGPFSVIFLMGVVLYWLLRDSETEEKQEDSPE